MKPISIALVGATGRFSSDILTEIENNNNFIVSNAITREGNQFVGLNISEISNYHKTNVVISDNFTNINIADVIIDVTTRNAFINDNSDIYKKAKKPLIIATTAFTEEDIKLIEELSKLVPVMIAANFSENIILFIDEIKRIMKRGVFSKVDIVEKHHKYKLDSPSGTAVKILQAINEVDKDIEVEVSSIREGDIIGEHHVTFHSPKGEIIKISHKLESRRQLATGVIQGASFIFNQDNGLFTTENMLERAVM